MATANKASPPKPWERAGAGASSAAALSSSPVSTLPPSTTNSSSSISNDSSSAPALPARPADMGSAVSGTNTSTALASQNYNANRYGGAATTGYGGYGATGYGGNTYGGSSYGAYSSPYSRMGGFGGGYGGFGGGYGGGYGGGFGASPYGYGGAPGGMNDMSLTRQMEAGTQATFQLLQSVVGAFGGFAQMLESTYMATHSSFFAMIGVAEQFASLRTWLGEVLSVFTLLRFVKRMLGWGGGAEQTAASNGMSAAEFSNFSATGRTSPLGSNGQAAAAAAGGAPGKPKVSKKPIVIFFLTVIGLPWLMNKLVKLITAKQQAEARRLGLPEGAIPPILDQNGQPLPQHLQPPGVDLALFNNPQLAQQQRAEQEAAIDPASLTFVRAQYDHASNDEFELSFNKGDIIAVLTPKEERIEPGWWRGRLRDGRIGWFPSTHVQEIPMNNAQKKLEQPALNEKATKA